MTSRSYDSGKPTESQLHFMVAPESIHQANELAALNHLSVSDLFAHLVLAEWERNKRPEKRTFEA
jgi:hypothetical protein